MRFIKQTPRKTYGYETTEITKEEALKYVSEETLTHLYEDFVKRCGANSALEQIGDELLYIGVAR